VDAIYPQPNTDVLQAVQGLGSSVQYNLGEGLVWEHYNLNEKNTFLADKSLRQAIFTAINREDILNRTIGQFVPGASTMGNHIYVPGQPGYQDNTTASGQGAGDVDKAKQILTDAGYTGVGSNLKTKSGKTVTLSCTYSEGNPYRQTECEIMQSTLKALGVQNVKLRTTADLSELDTGNYDIIVFAWVGTPYPVAGAQQLYTFNGGVHFAFTYNKDPQAEKFINEAFGETDQTKVQSLLNQADKLLQTDAFELPLYQKPTFLAAKTDIVNMRDNATSVGPPYNVQEWGVKAT
jgi:peptide/nickel transport system substrate-binding protein